MRRLASGIVLFERAAPAMGSGACAASGASNASYQCVCTYLAEARGRALGLGLLQSMWTARRGGPGGAPTTPGAARTVRSRPDASELETLVSHFR